jgi:thiosulfate/3-mercaptopyruvate sulfurtransferase
MWALLSPAAFGQNAAPLLVDVDWLSGHRHDRDLVLLHVGPKAEYDSKHIPGARFVLMTDLAKPMKHDGSKEIMLELPAADDFRAKLESIGVSDDSRIVLYVGADGTFQTGTRILFTLDYFGMGDRVSILNGGLTAWTTAGKPVTTDVPAVKPGKLSAHPTKNTVADAEFVKSLAQRPNYRLVDARDPKFYSGVEPTYEKRGHIPGAINIPFSQITTSNKTVDPKQVAEVFHQAGIKPGDTVVAYCHIGQQATAVIFGARLLGYPVMLYDGSFEDWATNNRGPVEK